MTVLFFSGYPGMRFDVHQRLYAKVPGRLLSMHEKYVQASALWLRRSERFDCSTKELMFDSGAFTAWTQREPVDVHRLLDLYRWVDNLTGSRFKDKWFISLDVIPGAPPIPAVKDAKGNEILPAIPARMPDHAEIKECIKRSDENHKVLADAFGHRVIPVFHQGEHPDRLVEVIEINPSYIGISPQNQIFEELRWRWARNVHDQLRSKIKTHGLATTGGTMMEMIDWRSVDSKRWVDQAAYGSIMIDWKGKLTTLPISERSPARAKFGGHFNTLADDDDRVLLVHETCDQLDIKPDMLRARDTYRYLFNAHVMTQWSKRPFAREVLA
jgi:hypothetical protein